LALSACSSDPTAPSVPTPTPTPVAATPAPCAEGACGNTNAVVRATLRLYLVWDKDGKVVTPTPQTEKQKVLVPLAVGSKFRLDLVGRDANDKETNGQKNITYVYSEGAELVEDIQMREDGFQKDVKVVAPGKFSVYVVFDGVASNSLVFTFVP
jgi:hypothetical protein